MRFKSITASAVLCAVLLSAVPSAGIAGSEMAFAAGTESYSEDYSYTEASGRDDLNISDESITLFLDSYRTEEGRIKVDVCALSSAEWKYDTISLRFTYDCRLKLVSGPDDMIYRSSDSNYDRSFVQFIQSYAVPKSLSADNPVIASFEFEVTGDESEPFVFEWADESEYSFSFTNTENPDYENGNMPHSSAGNVINTVPVNKHEHSFTVKNDSPEALKNAASCSHNAEYWYTCEECGEPGTEEWYEKPGTVLLHTDADKNGKCDVCGDSVVTITLQPSDAAKPAGKKAKFKVKASGKRISYQWQRSKDGLTWENMNKKSAKTKTLKVKVTEEKDGWLFRCIVTSGNAVVVSDPASLAVVE